MAISEIVQCSPEAQNYLVWKHPEENFSTTSQLIVDPTHEALLVQNGNAADLFGEGRHTLTTANIPLLSRLVEIPTGGKTAFPSKIYFINKVHQMDMRWGTREPVPVEDPQYNIFLHVMIRGSLTYSIVDARKFLLKLAGLKDKLTADDLVPKFRGIIERYVKDRVSKIMIDRRISYFKVSSKLMEISDALQQQIGEVFDQYGVEIEFFNVEAITVQRDDYSAVSEAMARRTSRQIEGYTWQEERQMTVAERFASNEGSVGVIGGVVGGAMGGMAMGSAITEITKNALGEERAPAGGSPVRPDMEAAAGVSEPAAAGGKKFCTGCGHPLTPQAKFCPECGRKVESDTCPNCGKPRTPGANFCSECGFDLR